MSKPVNHLVATLEGTYREFWQSFKEDGEEPVRILIARTIEMGVKLYASFPDYDDAGSFPDDGDEYELMNKGFGDRLAKEIEERAKYQGTPVKTFKNHKTLYQAYQT